VALCDLLIKPVQRITKYQLMLSDILKYSQRAGDKVDVLEKALEVMKVVPKACDDMMQVGRLQNFEGNLNAQGRLLFQGTLQISDGGPNLPFRGKERRVFLFEQSAIIADCIPPRKEYGNPTYIFKNQIMVGAGEGVEREIGGLFRLGCR
jgi:RhoGEF domain